MLIVSMSTETLITGDEPAADRRILVDVIGKEAPVRILAVLIGEADRDLNPSEIYEEAGVSSSTFYNHIDDLRAWGLVEKTRMAGNSPMYQINKDSTAAERLANFEWELIEHLVEKEEAGELDEENRPILVDE
jgi:DNA-binding transcriptional ArsR family regulator